VPCCVAALHAPRRTTTTTNSSVTGTACDGRRVDWPEAMTRIKLSGNWKELLAICTTIWVRLVYNSGISGQNHLLDGHWEVHKIQCISLFRYICGYIWAKQAFRNWNWSPCVFFSGGGEWATSLVCLGYSAQLLLCGAVQSRNQEGQLGPI